MIHTFYLSPVVFMITGQKFVYIFFFVKPIFGSNYFSKF
nr:MAG TPA: hypothetical protein [Caudoviricetes sp.]